MIKMKLFLPIFFLLLTTSLVASDEKDVHQKEQATDEPAVIYQSIDMGNSWMPFANGIPMNAILSGIKQDGHKLYVTTDAHGLFVTSDGENDWQSLGAKTLSRLDINCLEVNIQQLAVGTFKSGVFISNDGGVTWQPAKTDMSDIPIRAFIKYQGKLLAGTDAGIFESKDMGNTWSPSFGQMQVLGFTVLEDKVFAATQHGALICHGNTSYWTSIYDGDALHDIGNDGTHIYAMTIGQQLLKTKDAGQTWENAQNGIPYPDNFYTNELQHIRSDIFSAQWKGIYHSSDLGTNWRQLEGLPDETAFSTLAITDYGILAGISIRSKK